MYSWLPGNALVQCYVSTSKLLSPTSFLECCTVHCLTDLSLTGNPPASLRIATSNRDRQTDRQTDSQTEQETGALQGTNESCCIQNPNTMDACIYTTGNVHQSNRSSQTSSLVVCSRYHAMSLLK